MRHIEDTEEATVGNEMNKVIPEHPAIFKRHLPGSHKSFSNISFLKVRISGAHPYRKLALSSDIQISTVSDSSLGPQVERWAAQYAASVNFPGAEADPKMLALISWLQRHVPEEDAGSSGPIKGLVHGDYRLDNLVFHPTEPRVIAVRDVVKQVFQVVDT